MNIKVALMQMDALDDDQWTADDVPKLTAISEAVGKKVSRQDVVDAAPEFTRNNMVVLEEPPEEEEPQDEPQEEPDLKSDLSVLRDYTIGEPLTERDFITFLMRVNSLDLPGLETVLIEQLDQASKAVSVAEELRNRVKLSLAYTKNRVKREIPDMSNQQAIQSFIKSQAASRADKILRTRKILQGVDLKSLDPRAAIDRAMARKTTRGTQRPSRIM